MATIAPPLPKPKAQSPVGSGDGFDQGDSGGNGDHGAGRPGSLSDQRYYTGMMLGLAAIVMLFAAFTSAYIVRKGLSDDWRATVVDVVGRCKTHPTKQQRTSDVMKWRRATSR